MQEVLCPQRSMTLLLGAPWPPLTSFLSFPSLCCALTSGLELMLMQVASKNITFSNCKYLLTVCRIISFNLIIKPPFPASSQEFWKHIHWLGVEIYRRGLHPSNAPTAPKRVPQRTWNHRGPGPQCGGRAGFESSPGGADGGPGRDRGSGRWGGWWLIWRRDYK